MATKTQEYEERSRYFKHENAGNKAISYWREVWQRSAKATKVVWVMVPILAFLFPAFIGFPIVGAILCPVAGFLITGLFVAAYKPEEFDPEKKVRLATEDIYGDARLANIDERHDMFEYGNYRTQKGNIVGRDPDTGELLSIRVARGMNGNIVVFGSPGSGKTTGLVINTIMQSLRRGESLIVTDPKGENYAKTANMWRAHGATVKAIVFAPQIMTHSDAADFMKVVGKNDLKANSLAKTIIDNAVVVPNGGKRDFWSDSEEGLLSALILLHMTGGEQYGKTLGDLYKYLVEHDTADLADTFDNLTWDSPAKGSGMNFASGTDTIKSSTKASLGLHIKTLNNKILQKVCGTDEVDFTLPGREQCIYYVIASDHDSSLMFYQSTFFTLLFQELTDYADYSTTEQRLPVKVTFLLDEFKNIGKIPNFVEYLSTLRGRGMDIIIILQNLGQLMQMYPDEEYTSILDDCSTHLLLRTNDIINTAKYFEGRSGIMSIITRADRFFTNRMDAMEMHLKTQATDTYNKRNTLNADQVIRMKNSDLLIATSGHNIAKVKKAYYFSHPMCKELRDTNILHHVPEWMKQTINTALDENDGEIEATVKDLEDYGIHTVEQLEQWVKDCDYDNDLVDTIELCTEKDFSEPWTPEKQKDLDIKLTGEIVEEHLEKKEKDEEEFDAEKLTGVLEENAILMNNSIYVSMDDGVMRGPILK